MFSKWKKKEKGKKETRKKIMETKASLMSYEYILGAPNPNWLLIFVATLVLNWKGGVLRHMFQTTGSLEPSYWFASSEQIFCANNTAILQWQISNFCMGNGSEWWNLSWANSRTLGIEWPDGWALPWPGSGSEEEFEHLINGKDGTQNAIGLSY